MSGTIHVEKHPTEEEIDEILEESFPASDPPSWTLGIENPELQPDAEEQPGPASAGIADG